MWQRLVGSLDAEDSLHHPMDESVFLSFESPFRGVGTEQRDFTSMHEALHGSLPNYVSGILCPLPTRMANPHDSCADSSLLWNGASSHICMVPAYHTTWLSNHMQHAAYR